MDTYSLDDHVVALRVHVRKRRPHLSLVDVSVTLKFLNSIELKITSRASRRRVVQPKTAKTLSRCTFTNSATNVGAARRRPRGAARRTCAGAGPIPRAGLQLAVTASTGGLPLLGAHSLLSAGFSRRTTTRCGSVSWASSGRCQSQSVCGVPAVWVVCRGV